MFQIAIFLTLLIAIAKLQWSNMRCPLEIHHAGNGEGKNRQLGLFALPRRLSAAGNHDSRTGLGSAHLSRRPLSPSLPPRMKLTIAFTF